MLNPAGLQRGKENRIKPPKATAATTLPTPSGSSANETSTSRKIHHRIFLSRLTPQTNLSRNWKSTPLCVFPKIWRYAVKHNRVHMYELKRREYTEIRRSRSFPVLTREVLVDFIDLSKTQGQKKSLAAFREWLNKSR